MTSRQKDLLRIALMYFEANVDDVMESIGETDSLTDEDTKNKDKIERPTEQEFNDLFYIVK